MSVVSWQDTQIRNKGSFHLQQDVATYTNHKRQRAGLEIITTSDGKPEGWCTCIEALVFGYNTSVQFAGIFSRQFKVLSSASRECNRISQKSQGLKSHLRSV